MRRTPRRVNEAGVACGSRRASDLVFIRVVPVEGEFWDASRSASLRSLFDQAKSLVTRDVERGASASKVHARVDL